MIRSVINVAGGTTTHAPVQDGSARGLITGAVAGSFSILFLLTHASVELVAAAVPVETFLGYAAWGIYDKIVKPRFDILVDDVTTTDPPETLHATSEPPTGGAP